MLNNKYHRLLSRQLKKSGLNIQDKPEYEEFLKMVNDAYMGFDNDVNHIENIFEESSKELFIANQSLVYERDNTKTQLENIVDNIGGIVFETDLNGNFTFLNSAWKEYTGIPMEKALGRSFKEFLMSDYIEEQKKIRYLFIKEKRHIKFIFKYQRKETLMWFEVRSKLIRSRKGLPTGYIGTVTDITNLKETEIKLKKANKSKDVFLSTMSHEIRTPLNAVTGLTNILLMEDYLPEQLENIKALKYSGEHLLGLINDLLDFDKINSGKLKIVEKDFSFTVFLDNIKSEFSLRTKEKGLDFYVVLENDIPYNLVGDKLRLAQIIKNLLSNSLKFTEKGSITLHVKNLGRDKNKINLEFKIMDTGIGISKKRQKSIFKSFIQENAETSIKYGGTGLGLSISKKLLNIQGSNLMVESESGKGAMFYFEILFKISNRLNVFEPDTILLQPDYEPLNLNVLIAEDNKMNVLILKRFFKKWEVNFTIAENGFEVLDLFNETDFNFDIILMDIQMPKLNGYETTRIIRESENNKNATIPIIALTAFAQTDVKQKTERYKMNGFMGKPFNPIKLYELLKLYSKGYDVKK